MAVVVPEPGTESATARLLLDLAENVQDVQTAGNGTSFVVPDSLADAYNAARDTSKPKGGRRTAAKKE